MSEQVIQDRSAEGTTAGRLVDAGIALIADGGLRALTIRDVAASAGIAFPSVQHHFPTKAILVDEIFAAVELRHCAVTGHGLTDLTLESGGEAALPDVVAAVLADWCASQRTLTIAAHEMLLAAHRDPRHRAFGERWIKGQLDVWTGFLDRLGLGGDSDAAWIIVELLLGLSLMTFGCENQVEAALANAEIIRYAFADAAGRQSFDPRWYRVFLARGDRMDLPVEDSGSAGPVVGADHPAARKILDAGIGIVAEEGAGALTFRGVAARAGVAISSVTNNFHTRQNLIYRIYRHVQDNMTEIARNVGGAPPPAGELDPFSPASLVFNIAQLKKVLAGELPPFQAAYDLMLAGARDPTYGRRAWRIRMTRGVYLLIRRGVMPAQPLRAQFQAHVQSLWANAVALLCGIGASSSRDRDLMLKERLRAGFDRLR